MSGDKCSSDTEQENPLEDRGDNSDHKRKCELCGSLTNQTEIPIKQTAASGFETGSAVQLLACEDCQIRLWQELYSRYGDGEKRSVDTATDQGGEQ